jgi:secreted PhoX family phosphatase
MQCRHVYVLIKFDGADLLSAARTTTIPLTSKANNTGLTMAQTSSSSTISRRRLLQGSAVAGALFVTPLAARTEASASAAAEQYVSSIGKSILGVASGSKGAMS